MQIDNLFFSEDARGRLISGIQKCAKAVGQTLGTGGSNCIIEAIESPKHLTTNDGATILASIHFADPIEEMGRNILLEAVARSNRQSGDGSSTTTVLTAAIIEQGLRVKGIHPLTLKRELEACIPLIQESLQAQSREVTVDNVANVAAISAEDEAIGALIQEIYQQIGKDGIIHWDISKTTEDIYTVGSGLTINGAGYLSPYMTDMDEKTGQFLNIAKWKNPYVLIVKQKITTAADFNTLFSSLYAKDIKEVVVFCDEIEAAVVPDLIQTRAQRGFKTLVVKMPTIWKDQWYEDLALASGATIIDANAGIPLKQMKMEHLGRFGNITVTNEDTFIDGVQDLTDHVRTLEEEGTDDSLIRASRLNTKTARLFIGAHSDSALSYKRLKVEDAISAAWQALHGGVVAGGGSALITALDALPNTVGGRVLKEALTAPARQIATNAGHLEVVIGDDYRKGRGLDTRTGEFVDMFEANIVNPANVEINACKNAISVAAAILTAPTVVTLPKHDETLS